ncbi:hypothetical protein SNEBB_010841 [Seison nebaliae]|nr:hypothetical protein SNEBB_010841 [Seison nebaliae]
MTRIALYAISFILGFFFVCSGLIKITPSINKDIYEDLKKEFGQFNKVFPLYRQTGWRPFAKNYRATIAWIEIICGSLLIVGPGYIIQQTMAFILLMVMCGAFYTLYALDSRKDKFSACVIFGLLLCCRMLLSYQANKRDVVGKKKKMEKVQNGAGDDETNEIESEQPIPVNGTGAATAASTVRQRKK